MSCRQVFGDCWVWWVILDASVLSIWMGTPKRFLLLVMGSLCCCCCLWTVSAASYTFFCSFALHLPPLYVLSCFKTCETDKWFKGVSSTCCIRTVLIHWLYSYGLSFLSSLGWAKSLCVVWRPATLSPTRGVWKLL